jgi:hypothetical protein
MAGDIKHSRRIDQWICRPSAETAPTINGFIVIAWALFWAAQQFVFLRSEGISKALESIAIWSGVIALFAIACIFFLLLRRAARQLVARWRLLAASAAALAVALGLALLIASAVSGPHAAHDLPITAWAIVKPAILGVLGLAMVGWAVWANVKDASLPLAGAFAAAALVTSLVAALLATQLPTWALGILALATLAGLGWLGARKPDAAKAVAMLAALLASVLLLNATDGAPFWILILPVTAAWVSTYVRFGTEPDNPRWWLALLQYACWIIVTASEACVVK